MPSTQKRVEAFSEHIQGKGEILSNSTSHKVSSGTRSIMAPYMPLGGDGYSKDNEATATCFCGAVQLAFVC